MPDSLEGILLVMGGLFLLVGLIDGEFEVSVAKIPRVGTPGRIGAIAVGVVCLTLALKSIIGGRSPAEVSPSTAVQQNVAPAAVVAPPAVVAPAPSASPARTSEDCVSGYVWREARPSDLVCVTSDTRTRTAQENAAADANRLGSGEYGPNTCKAGLVWRVAFDGDVVCVTPESREQAAEDNRLSPGRKAH